METLRETLHPAFRKDLAQYILLSIISFFTFKGHNSILDFCNEILLYIGATNISPYLPWIPYIFSLMPMIIMFSLMLQTYLTSYEFQDNRLMYTTGVLNRISDPIEYYRIKDVVIESSIFDAIFRLGKMTIVSTDRTYPILRITGVSRKKIDNIEPLLRDKIEASKEGGRGREVDIV